jgi:hypothetical protein
MKDFLDFFSTQKMIFPLYYEFILNPLYLDVLECFLIHDYP